MPAPDLEQIAARLAAGRGVLGGRVRYAVMRSGVALGFPREPFVHLSWPALAGAAVLIAFVRRAR